MVLSKIKNWTFDFLKSGGFEVFDALLQHPSFRPAAFEIRDLGPALDYQKLNAALSKVPRIDHVRVSFYYERGAESMAWVPTHTATLQLDFPFFHLGTEKSLFVDSLASFPGRIFIYMYVPGEAALADVMTLFDVVQRWNARIGFRAGSLDDSEWVAQARGRMTDTRLPEEDRRKLREILKIVELVEREADKLLPRTVWLTREMIADL